MAAELKDAFEDIKVELVEGSGGVFEVTVDGRLIFSKKALGRHAASGEILGLIRQCD